MPGIEARAPERTETSSGFSGSPKPLPDFASRSASAASTCAAQADAGEADEEGIVGVAAEEDGGSPDLAGGLDAAGERGAREGEHQIGDAPTDLALHPNSAAYRLILNNVLFPAAKKKKQKT